MIRVRRVHDESRSEASTGTRYTPEQYTGTALLQQSIIIPSQRPRLCYHIPILLCVHRDIRAHDEEGACRTASSTLLLCCCCPISQRDRKGAVSGSPPGFSGTNVWQIPVYGASTAVYSCQTSNPELCSRLIASQLLAAVSK